VRRLTLAALCAALCFNSAVSLHAATNVRSVAVSGQPAPGGNGAVYSSFTFDSLRLLDGGRTAFGAKLAIGPGGVTADSDSGLWSERDGALDVVLREGSAAPGAPVGAVFGETIRGNWNPSGSLALQTGLRSGVGGVTAANDIGVWSDVGGSLQMLAREGDAAPGTGAGVVWGEDFLGPELNSSGAFALRGSLRTGIGGVTVDDNEGIWVQRGGPLTLLVREGDQAPGGPVGAIFGGSNLDLINLSYPEIDAAGLVSFNGYMREAGVGEAPSTGFWSERSGSVQLLYRSGMQAPGAASGVTFFSFGGFPYTNADGRYSDQHTLSGGDVTDVFVNGIGVYNDAGGTLTEIARSGQQAPGADSGTLFSFLAPPSFSDEGNSSFYATLRNATNNLPAAVNEGIWSDASDALTKVLQKGDISPGTGGALFGAVGRPVLNNAGQIAVPMNLVLGTSGVTSANDEGYWAQDLAGNLRLLVREGDSITVSPGDVRTIANFGLNGDSRGFAFDDLGNLFFRANFTDGSQGLFVARVPEPTSLILSLSTCIVAVGRRRAGLA
jgi:hypothetical protein